MKLEFVKTDENIPFDCCPCTGHDFFEDIKDRDCITIDGASFSMYSKPTNEYACQFPYTMKDFDGIEYGSGKYCTKGCGKIPYRIIKKRG